MDFAKEPDAVFGRKRGSLAPGADGVIQMIPLHFGKKYFQTTSTHNKQHE